jgi:cytochrome bd-type quinol oxidase subunit 2
MEEKLFWIGLLVGLHYYLTRVFAEKKRFASERFFRLWHAVFASLMAFIAAVLLAVTMDNRSGDAVTTSLFSARQLLYGAAAALAGGSSDGGTTDDGTTATDIPLDIPNRP